MRKISRKTAKARGLKRYFTGMPCPNGHVAERHVANRTCITCTTEIYRAKIKKDPTTNQARASRWAHAHMGKVVARVMQWRIDNPERYREQRRRYEDRKRRLGA
jgi:hypothetical protein